MRRLSRTWLYTILIIVVPTAGAAGWWYYYPHYLLGQAAQALAANDLTRAETLVKKAITQDPKNYQSHLLAAQIARRLKKPVDAQMALQQAVDLGLPEADGQREFALAEAAKGFRRMPRPT
jgi:predicted Zn-dependent protease